MIQSKLTGNSAMSKSNHSYTIRHVHFIRVVACHYSLSRREQCTLCFLQLQYLHSIMAMAYVHPQGPVLHHITRATIRDAGLLPPMAVFDKGYRSQLVQTTMLASRTRFCQPLPCACALSTISSPAWRPRTHSRSIGCLLSESHEMVYGRVSPSACKLC